MTCFYNSGANRSTVLLFSVALVVSGCAGSFDTAPVSGAVYADSSSYALQSPGVDLSGRWFHDGQPTKIHMEPDGRSFTIINEFGQRNSGYMAGPRELVIPSLGIRGHLSHGQGRISWSNGTEWTREPSAYGRGPGVGIDGRWFHDGKPTSISADADGRNFTIVNEIGQRNNGYMAGPRELVIPSLGIRGRLSHGERTISWSNGTEWNR